MEVFTLINKGELPKAMVPIEEAPTCGMRVGAFLWNAVPLDSYTSTPYYFPMRSYFFILLYMSSSFLFSQRENANWHFGCFAGINFSEDGTITQIPSSLQSREGTASVSDAEGNLLFYTDGSQIYNASGEVTVSGLLGSPSSTTAVAALPVSDNEGEYWIFTTDFFRGVNGTNYYRYDATSERLLAGPTRIVSNNTEKLAAYYNCETDSYWVLTQNVDGDYLIFRVGASVELHSTVTALPRNLDNRQVVGQLKFSEDGTQLANVLPSFLEGQFGGIVQIYSFDPESGNILNPDSPSVLDFNQDENGDKIGFVYGTQFSPSGELLYVSILVNDDRAVDGGELYQFDLLASNVNSTRTLVGQSLPTNGYAGMSLGPDGKIYMAIEAANEATSSCNCFGTYDYLGIINAPDSPGNSCDFVQDGVFLATGQFTGNCGNSSAGGGKLGLPFHISGRKPSVFSSQMDSIIICPGDSIQLLSGLPQDGANYIISGPDIMSQDFFLIVAPDTTTTYSIRIDTDFCPQTVNEVTIVVPAPLGLTIQGDTTICADAPLSLVAEANGTATPGTYIWVLPNEETVAGAELALSSPLPGSYTVIFMDEQSCNIVSKRTQISVAEETLNPNIVATLSDGTLLTSNATLNAGSILVLSVTNLPGGQQYQYEWEGNFTPSEGDESTLTVTVPSNSDQGNEPLRYQVTITPESPGCPVTLTVALNRVQGDYAIPEMITPNGDGTNDNFRLFYQGLVENFQLIIFNRWGQEVFSTDDSERAWDGTVDGEAQNSDVYLYIMAFDLEGVRVEEEGSFSLIR